MNRGDLYWVNLDPTVGSEIRKKRPCILISATSINQARRTVVIIPLSTSAKAHPPLTISVHCMGKHGVMVCDQIRAVDKSRLTEKIGILSENELKKLEEGLRQILCL